MLLSMTLRTNHSGVPSSSALANISIEAPYCPVCRAVVRLFCSPCHSVSLSWCTSVHFFDLSITCVSRIIQKKHVLLYHLRWICLHLPSSLLGKIMPATFLHQCEELLFDYSVISRLGKAETIRRERASGTKATRLVMWEPC